FFQAEDGIRDFHVTGVQTCALPIYEEFLGVISGVTEWGIYVEIIENKCEGMVRISDLKDDYYEFDPNSFSMVGDTTGKTYQLGDEVFVKMKSFDLQKRHLDFVITGKKLTN